MSSVLSFIVYLLCIYGTYKVAENNGRNTLVALVLGIVFSAFALIGYVLLGKKQ